METPLFWLLAAVVFIDTCAIGGLLCWLYAGGHPALLAAEPPPRKPPADGNPVPPFPFVRTPGG